MERGKTWVSLTAAVLRHRLYVEAYFLMMPLSTLPVKPIHAACVAWREQGIMLCGDSGAGKSTLSYACARVGWDYISDDMSLLIDGSSRLVAGNSELVRFRPAAAELFPEIRGLELTPRAMGKPSIELSTFSMRHVKRCEQARVDFVVFLNRRNGGPPALVPYRKDVARLYMSQGLYESDQQERHHLQAVDRLLERDVLELRYSDLGWAVDRLRRLIEEGI
jgi:energy-coupling factor transporter ATP-binding protein EcfA2